MRAPLLMQMIATAGFLTCAGCYTEQPARTSGAYDSTYYQAYPQPAASPSQRPGLNPDDPRDPQFGSRPNPTLTPPTTKP